MIGTKKPKERKWGVEKPTFHHTQSQILNLKEPIPDALTRRKAKSPTASPRAVLLHRGQDQNGASPNETDLQGKWRLRFNVMQKTPPRRVSAHAALGGINTADNVTMCTLCPICASPFMPKGGRKRTSCCGTAICATCVEKIRRERIELRPADQSVNKRRCPFCRVAASPAGLEVYSD